MTEQEWSDRVVHAVAEAGREGASRDEIAEVLGVPGHHRGLRAALKAASKDGRIVRVAADTWALIPKVAASLRGVIERDDDRFFLVDDEQRVAEVLADGLGTAVAGDRVVVDVTEVDALGRPLGIVSSVERSSPRRAGRTRFARGVAIVEIEGAGELAWVPARWADSLRNGVEGTFEVWGRGAPPRGLKGFPARALIVRPVASDSPRAVRPQRQPAAAARSDGGVTSRVAFSRIRTGELHAARILDQLAEGLGLPLGFGPEILDEVAAYDEPEGLLDGDLDLRAIPLVTIDGADAKDFDDAVFAEEIGGEIHLIVAVADVSHYVAEGSLLDEEAQRRGCSVYLPGRVYPMLPHRLSDDLCSLRPHVLRRCAWVSILVRASGEVTAYDAGFGLMRSWARLTYEQVEEHLEGVKLDVPDKVATSIDVLERLRTVLYARRKQRGLLDLDLPEPRIRLTEDGAMVREIEPAPRLRSHRLIEECMLLANETIADLLSSRHWPAIYRTHADANSEKLEPALELLRSWGLPVEVHREPSLEELDQILTMLAGDPSGQVFSYLVLRSMAKAVYSTDEAGHFGIGADRYVHFTSPIRRYPDLWIHRMLRRALAAGGPPSTREANTLRKRLDGAARSANEGEKLANQAERYAQRLLRARMMIDRVGDVFEGVVSDVFPFGAFVTIQSPYVDGMIPIRRLGRGWWQHDEADMALVCEATSERVRVGDVVRVRCTDVDLGQARVNLDRISSHPPRRTFDRIGATPVKRREGKRRAGARDEAATKGRTSERAPRDRGSERGGRRSKP